MARRIKHFLDVGAEIERDNECDCVRGYSGVVMKAVLTL
jgi:hypothetical protein